MGSHWIRSQVPFPWMPNISTSVSLRCAAHKKRGFYDLAASCTAFELVQARQFVLPFATSALWRIGHATSTIFKASWWSSGRRTPSILSASPTASFWDAHMWSSSGSRKCSRAAPSITYSAARLICRSLRLRWATTACSPMAPTMMSPWRTESLRPPRRRSPCLVQVRVILGLSHLVRLQLPFPSPPAHSNLSWLMLWCILLDRQCWNRFDFDRSYIVWMLSWFCFTCKFQDE